MSASRRETIAQMFNQFGGQARDVVVKAISTAATSAGALDREQLEKVITSTVFKLSALVAMWDIRNKPGITSKFSRRTSLPSPGSAIGEGADTATKDSTYEKVGVDKKVFRRKGRITGFAAEGLNAEDVDIVGMEIQAHIEAITYDMETNGVYGNATANPYEWSGYETFIKTNYADVSKVIALKDLDDMLDANGRRGGMQHKLGFVASPELISKLTRDMITVQQMTNYNIPTVEIQGGWNLVKYKNAVMLPHAGMRPNKVDLDNVIGVVGAVQSDTGGSFPDSTQYFFYVAPITWDGEQLPSSVATVTTSAAGGGAHSITLSWADVPNAMKYYVYFGTTTGELNCPLKKIVGADLYDGTGKVTGRRTSLVLTAPAVGAEVPTHMQANVPLREVGGIPEERIMLIDFDRFQGMGGFDYANPSGSALNGLVSVKPLAETDDWQEFLLKNYGCLLDAYEKTSSHQRRVRVG